MNFTVECGQKGDLPSLSLARSEGLLERNTENSYLDLDAVDGDPLGLQLCHSITYRIALGPQAGHNVFTLKKLSASDPERPFGCYDAQGSWLLSSCGCGRQGP